MLPDRNSFATGGSRTGVFGHFSLLCSRNFGSLDQVLFAVVLQPIGRGLCGPTSIVLERIVHLFSQAFCYKKRKTHLKCYALPLAHALDMSKTLIRRLDIWAPVKETYGFGHIVLQPLILNAVPYYCPSAYTPLLRLLKMCCEHCPCSLETLTDEITPYSFVDASPKRWYCIEVIDPKLYSIRYFGSSISEVCVALNKFELMSWFQPICNLDKPLQCSKVWLSWLTFCTGFKIRNPVYHCHSTNLSHTDAAPVSL